MIEKGYRSLLYASFGYTTHDHRFLKCFLDDGWKVAFLRFDGLKRQLCSIPLPEEIEQIDWLGTKTMLTTLKIRDFQLDALEVTRRINPQVILAGPVPTIGYILATVSEVPTVLMSWASDLLIDIFESDQLLAQSKDAIELSAGIIVDSETVAEIATGLGAEEANLLVVPWGLDLKEFSPGTPRKPDGIFKIFSTRTLEKIYDIETLIRAAALLRSEFPDFNFLLSIVGGGSEESNLRKLASSLQVVDYIKWIPRVNENELRSVILANDLYISTAISDGSSVSMLQAMSCGQLTLVTNLKSNMEWIINDWNGWLFDAGDASDLAKTIFKIANSPIRSSIRINAPTAVHERADWDENQMKVTNYVLSCIKA